jgi:phage gp36-like protein
MAYSVKADLEQHTGGPDGLIQLADYDQDGIADQTVIDNAIADADGIINGYINKQVLVPLSTVPVMVKNLSARLALYSLRMAKRQVDPDTHGKQFDLDLQMLKDLRDGVITLGVDPAPPAASARIDSVSERPTSKARSRSNLRGFS